MSYIDHLKGHTVDTLEMEPCPWVGPISSPKSLPTLEIREATGLGLMRWVGIGGLVGLVGGICMAMRGLPLSSPMTYLVAYLALGIAVVLATLAVRRLTPRRLLRNLGMEHVAGYGMVAYILASCVALWPFAVAAGLADRKS